jgi:uncharacterized protein with HEPN domain
MKKDQLRVLDYLNHICEAIERINTYTENTDEISFLQNKLVQDAVIRNIEIIGEAARNIEQHSPEFAAQHPDIPWEDMYLMRNRVSHGYFSVDLEVVWKTVQRDLPELEQQIRHPRDVLASHHGLP